MPIITEVKQAIDEEESIFQKLFQQVSTAFSESFANYFHDLH